MNDSLPLYIFIMAGGSGERFWPMSRNRLPKHLLRLLGNRTLLEETIERVRPLVPPDHLFVLTNQAQLTAIRDLLPFLTPDQVIAEPAKRDTGPAAALATAVAQTKDANAIVALLPSDSMIHNTDAFRRQLVDAARIASEQPCLVTVAITPTYPATGFGYLKLGAELRRAPNGSVVHQVLQFVEKPNPETAQIYLKEGNFGWNAGMFVWRAQHFLEECNRLSPSLADFICNFPSSDSNAYILKHFPKLPKNSVDYTIMENASSVVALRSQFDWDDVGSWTALPAHLGKDAEGNTLRGSTILVDAKNNIVIANHRIVALCGTQNLVVVETPDAILICDRNAVQDIKKIHPLLPKDLL